MSIHLIIVQTIITTITAALAVVSWRYRFRPGARPFVALTGVTTVLSATYLVSLAAPDDPVLSLIIVTVRANVFSVMPVLWVVFALDYTGFGRFVTKRNVFGLSVVPLVTITVLWVPSLRWLYWGPHTIDLARGVVDLSIPLGPWYWLNLGYGYLLMAVGFLLLFRLLVSDDHLYTDQSVAIVVGAIVPFVANVLLNLGITPLSFPLQPTSFVITGLAFAFALYRFELFDFLPITLQIGRDTAIEDLQEGVFILDVNGQIVDVNRAGADIFEQSPSALVGQSLEAIVGDQAPADDVAPSEYRTDDGRVYGVTVSRIHDHTDRLVGRTVVFRDVTDRELRELQLEVFNRVLRHDLRNKLNVVSGYAELLEDCVDDEEAELVEKQMAATEDLMSAGVRAREFDALDSREEATPQTSDIADLLRDLTDDLTTEFPDASVTVNAPSDLTLKTYPDVLEIVLDNLLQNAAEHADCDPEIEVTVTETGEGVEFAVRDNGPGIPEEELAVLDANTETALEHGSGLGLWITKWGVRYLRGDLTFEENDAEGTTVLVSVPRATSASEDAPSEPPTA